MYKIERKKTGYLLTFSGNMDRAEIERWLNESKLALAKESATAFGVIIDMRELAPLPNDAQEVMVEGQGLYKQKGMKRSAVIVANNVTAMQFQRLAKESGIHQWERYLSATTPDCNGKAVAWVKDGTDPDLT
ncbi:MAG: hypothetical protein OET90_10365 [Desulfuromonadales bacterium]|nr:hypothetical protein [Desulfuromonadales bacterium]